LKSKAIPSLFSLLSKDPTVLRDFLWQARSNKVYCKLLYNTRRIGWRRRKGCRL